MDESFTTTPQNFQHVVFNNRPTRFVVFDLDNRLFGLELSAVRRVVRAVEITPLPNSPALLLGLINMQGEIIYVVDTRKALGLPARQIELSDQLIVASASTRVVALVCDTVIGVKEFSDDHISPARKVSSSPWCFSGIVKTEDGVILILDLDFMISWEPSEVLDRRFSYEDARS